MFFCGIDWSDKDFVIVIVDQEGDTAKSFRVNNNAEGFTELIDRVRTVTTDKDNILFTIETPNCPLVDFLHG